MLYICTNIAITGVCYVMYLYILSYSWNMLYYVAVLS